jgi:nucleotide-binding universal stress UspA family protein/quercetin dioxygenase-like cupin family protein
MNWLLDVAHQPHQQLPRCRCDEKSCEAMPTMNTILHPTDFSPSAHNAFVAACSLARDNKARLILLHVIPPSVDPLTGVSPPNPLQLAESQETWKDAFQWPQPSDPQIAVEHRVAEGDAPEEILRLAETVKCDFIVLGTHGRTGLRRVLTGSVAEEVLRKATCPVVAVKAALLDTPRAEAKTPAETRDVIDVRPLGEALPTTMTKVLARGENLEVIRLVVLSGKEIAERKGKGEIVVQCLEGRVSFTAFGKVQELEAGNLLYLSTGEPFKVRGIENASLLLTMLLLKH